jgi:hypothetical protein
VWTSSLRICFAFGRPSCGRALCCVWAPILRTCLVFHCGRVLGCPSCGRALHCIREANLGEDVLKCLPPGQNLFLSILQLIFYPSAPLCGRFRCGSVFRLGAHLADVPCVAFGHLSCGRAFRCVAAPNLGEALLKSLPPSQNLFLSILQLVFLPSAPLCGRFHCG